MEIESKIKRQQDYANEVKSRRGVTIDIEKRKFIEEQKIESLRMSPK